jgi:hypothetical protein
MRLPAYALLALLLLPVPLAAQASDEDQVRAAVQQYFRGHATGDGAEMCKPFLPTAHVEGLRSNQFVSWTVEEYCALFKGTPAPDEASRVRRIDSIDVTGTAAIARATLVHGGTTFVDYFVLLKVDGAWKIANKVYVSRPTR